MCRVEGKYSCGKGLVRIRVSSDMDLLRVTTEGEKVTLARATGHCGFLLTVEASMPGAKGYPVTDCVRLECPGPITEEESYDIGPGSRSVDN